MVFHGLTVAMFFIQLYFLSFVRNFLEQKNIKSLTNDNKRLTNMYSLIITSSRNIIYTVICT